MSIRQNEEEAIRWLKSPDVTKVLAECYHGQSIDDPDLVSGCAYVVYDRHSELRKEWVDKGKPTVQYWNNFTKKWTDINGEPEWGVEDEYRIKPSEWVTPEWEDPIKYHAKRLNPDRENFCVVYLPDDNKYETRESTTSYVLIDTKKRQHRYSVRGNGTAFTKGKRHKSLKSRANRRNGR